MKKTQSMHDDLEAIAKVVRERRAMSGLSQIDLAKVVGCSNKQLWNIEHSKNWPSVPIFIRLCRSLSINPLTLQ